MVLYIERDASKIDWQRYIESMFWSVIYDSNGKTHLRENRYFKDQNISWNQKTQSVLPENLEAFTGFILAFMETMNQTVSFEAPYLIQVVKLISRKNFSKEQKRFQKT